jgi:hypothetical protein
MKNLFLPKGFYFENEKPNPSGFNMLIWLKRQLTYLGVSFSDPCCPSVVPPASTLTIGSYNYIGTSNAYVPPNSEKIITIHGTTGSIVTLPQASTCIGQIYILKNISTITTFAGDTNEATTTYPSYATKTFMIQSSGPDNSWILLSVF